MDLSLNSKHTYRFTGWLLFVVFGLFLIIVALSYIFDQSQSIFEIIVFSVCGLFFFYAGFSIRIVVSTEGIKFHHVGYSVKAKWDQVASIGYGRAGRVRTECLLLNEYEFMGIRWIAKFTGFFPGVNSIPVSLFEKDWRKGKLGHEIVLNAPRLLIVDK